MDLEGAPDASSPTFPPTSAEERVVLALGRLYAGGAEIAAAAGAQLVRGGFDQELLPEIA